MDWNREGFMMQCHHLVSLRRPLPRSEWSQRSLSLDTVADEH
ncbi:hypothetical protein WMF30_18755 [Sorangium sp. So ce134]